MDENYLLSLFSLQGKTAVVTGGGGVLCSTISRGLALAGARVAVLDLQGEKSALVAQEIEARGGKALPLQCDVLDRDSILAAADQVMRAFGRVDILINGAGGNNPRGTTTPQVSFFDLPEDAVQWIFNLNFLGTLLPCQVFGKIMAQAREGSIL